jgi:hypothetical protein
MNQIDDQLAFSQLIESGAMIPFQLEQSMNKGLCGEMILLQEDVKQIINLRLYDENGLFTQKQLDEIGIHLDDENYQKFIQVSPFADTLISTSIRTKYGWGIPCEESVQHITLWLDLQNQPGILEIGAGSGIWSGIISSRTNKDIVACELNLRGDTPKPTFYPVLNQDGVEIIKTHPNYPIMMIWPDTNDMSFKMAENLSVDNYLILIGQPSITGCNDFFTYLDQNFYLENTSSGLAFSGTTDPIYILKKLPEPKNNPDNFFSEKRNQGKIYLKIKAK